MSQHPPAPSMKTDTTTIPTFDEKTAKPVEPYRHEPTGRTVAFEQGPDLFSTTGVFVATAPAPKPIPPQSKI